MNEWRHTYIPKIIDEYTDRKDMSPGLKWYYRNRDRVLAWQRADYKFRPEVKERRKELRNSRPELFLFNSAKDRSAKNNIEFSIRVEDIKIPKFCPILQIELERFNRKTAPSLDRVDNSKGYIPSNIRVISNRANQLKGDMSFEDIERLFKYIKGELN